MMKRMRNNMQWKYTFQDAPDNNDYIPGQYIDSKREHDEAEESIELCLNNFRKALRIE